MISAKFLAMGKNFSGVWVNNWTGTLSFMAANKFNITWKFLDGKEPLIELNHAFKDTAKTDWVVILSSDVIWNSEQIKQLLLNNTYDAISGWKYLENRKTDVIQSLDTRSLLQNNSINYLDPNDILAKPIPFKVEYTSLSFVAFKTELIQNINFRPQYIISADKQKELLLPWNFSICKQFNEMGNEIFVDSRMQMKTILKQIL
jgi:hypothetical protein